MADTRPNVLDPPGDVSRDHVLGPPDAELTLVEYGRYACRHCQPVHAVMAAALRAPGTKAPCVTRCSAHSGIGENL
jgi:hypothetical protein